jgi:hypothetical protein
MKKSTFLKSIVAGLLLLAIATPPMTMAAAEDKIETIKGDGKCGKCALKETEKCQNVIQVEKAGKKTTYYLVENKVSKDFHDNVCKETKKVTATGTVKEVDGKKQFTATKIELAKE